MRIVSADGYEEPRDAISHDWIRTLTRWGMIPILIPNSLPDPAAFMNAAKVDLLVLTGGDDLGATPLRDGAETHLLKSAMDTGLPTIGVCRGMQLINQYLGGDNKHCSDDHSGTTHPISVEAAWHGIYAAATTVNSFHNSCIPHASLARGLQVRATDQHDDVEAFIHPSHAVIGIMWHPERINAPEGDENLIRGLVEKNLV